MDFWSEDRERILLAWVYANSFVSAHTDIGSWEEWMEHVQRVVPIHENRHEKAALAWPPLLNLGMAS